MSDFLCAMQPCGDGNSVLPRVSETEQPGVVGGRGYGNAGDRACPRSHTTNNTGLRSAIQSTARQHTLADVHETRTVHEGNGRSR